MKSDNYRRADRTPQRRATGLPVLRAEVADFSSKSAGRPVVSQVGTERAGFEPAKGFKPLTAFPVLLLRPLGHLSGFFNRRTIIDVAAGATRAFRHPRTIS